jgi:hypothetical protein
MDIKVIEEEQVYEGALGSAPGPSHCATEMVVISIVTARSCVLWSRAQVSVVTLLGPVCLGHGAPRKSVLLSRHRCLWGTAGVWCYVLLVSSLLPGQWLIISCLSYRVWFMILDCFCPC